jgi:hypothetical protein
MRTGRGQNCSEPGRSCGFAGVAMQWRCVIVILVVDTNSSTRRCCRLQHTRSSHGSMMRLLHTLKHPVESGVGKYTSIHVTEPFVRVAVVVGGAWDCCMLFPAGEAVSRHLCCADPSRRVDSSSLVAQGGQEASQQRLEESAR